jgi:hypothetical protein
VTLHAGIERTFSWNYRNYSLIQDDVLIQVMNSAEIGIHHGVDSI